MNRCFLRPSFHEHVVVESSLDGGSGAQVTPVESFHGLAQNGGRRVPEDVLAVLRVELDQFHLARSLEGTVQIPEGRPVQTRRHYRVRQPLTNPSRNLRG